MVDMKFLPIILMIFFLISARSQTSSPIGIEIITESVHASGEEVGIMLKLKCVNFADSNFLLYGFDSDFNEFTTIERICDVKRTSGRFALFIYTKSHDVLWPEWRIGDIDYKPMTRDSLDASLEREKLRYLKDTRVIKRNDAMFFEKKIALNDYHLEKGRYFVQIAYYAGIGVEKEIVGKAQVDRDKIVYDAELYQGCAVSNTITLIID
jgi:hypothetical protein